MASTTRPRRGHLAVVLVLAAAVWAALCVPSSSVASTGVSGPPSGVYTCEWIAAHAAAAAQAGVTCDPVALPATPFGSSRAPAAPMMMMDSGCSYVPGSGRVGQGVYAWTSYKYTTRWEWFGNYTPSSYTWYIQKTGEDTYVWGNVSDANNHGAYPPANIYRWGAQNHSSTPQSWYICWADN